MKGGLPLLIALLSGQLQAAPTTEAPPAAPAVAATLVSAPTADAKPPAVLVKASEIAAPPVAPPVLQKGNILIDGSLSPAQRAEHDLLANARKLDQANQELLSRNQVLAMQNENLTQQVKLLQEDRSAENIRSGALAVIAGVLLGWFLSGSAARRSRKSTW
ncbi:hypothetical protein EV700_1686 [Fluviicoccus keumensis]|uniref:SH3 domain protein n=1 Tax=Fluviicoccus keumensis TaxID=1435465 RepID=A0A4Q7Z5G4_9GAMM|nr:hypothetical protein [Fluviicoccus keumensis]RZU44885.1 hypothetical protein EV700_1686 [Fluviicoccus keumensis]